MLLDEMLIHFFYFTLLPRSLHRLFSVVWPENMSQLGVPVHNLGFCCCCFGRILLLCKILREDNKRCINQCDFFSSAPGVFKYQWIAGDLDIPPVYPTMLRGFYPSIIHFCWLTVKATALSVIRWERNKPRLSGCVYGTEI